MLSASSAYAFPASSATVTEWEPARFAVSGVPLVQGTATRFAASYKYDANEADGEAAFAGFLRADVDSNDLTTPNTAALTAAEAAMTAQISKPLQKRIYSCVLSPPKWAKAHVKLENRACRTVDIDVFITNAFV